MKKSDFYQLARRSMMLLVVLTMAMAMNAIPAKPGLTRTLQLVDGTTVQAQLVGDEFFHYWISSDGKTYMPDGDSNLYQLVNVESLKTKAQARRAQVNARRAKRLSPRR